MSAGITEDNDYDGQTKVVILFTSMVLCSCVLYQSGPSDGQIGYSFFMATILDSRELFGLE